MQTPPRTDLRRVVEALLFIGSAPVTYDLVVRCLPGVTREQFQQTIATLAEAYACQRRPYKVARTPRGAVLRLKAEAGEELAGRARSERGAKLPRAVVDALAVIAYRQPITRAAMEKSVGSDVGAAIRQLVRRRLIETQSTDSGEIRYVTTNRFLEMFELQDIDELPTVEEL